MKKIISTLTLCLCMTVLSLGQDPVTVFDPATFEGTFPGGTIVDIDGEKYLKVVLDGWNNSVDLEVGVPLGATLTATIKYAKGESALGDDQDVNFGFQFTDLNNQIPASWDPSQMVNVAVGVTAGKAATDFVTNSASVPIEIDYGVQMQVFAQETFGSWGPRTGDTVWVGKVTTEDFDHILFDPANFDPATLGDGFTIDTINGGLYLKATVDGWNTNIDIPEVTTAEYNKIVGNIKYEEGTSGVAATSAQSFAQLMPGEVGKFVVGDGPTEFTRTISSVTSGQTVTSMQIAAQNTSDWSAIVGADVSVGRIKAFREDLQKADPPKTYTVHYTPEIVELDGILDNAYFEHEIFDTIKMVSLGAVGSVSAGQDAMVDAGAGSFAEWTAIADYDYMYLYVEVEDNDVVNLGSSTTYWENDGVEVFIDGLDRRYVGEDRNGGGGQHQLRINIDENVTGSKGVFSGSGIFLNPEGTAPIENDSIQIKFANIITSSGYTMEIAIPWAAFYLNSSNTIKEAYDQAQDSLKNGTQMALELSLIDADVSDHRVSILSWSNPTGEDKSYSTAEYWGQFTLASFGSAINNKKFEQNKLHVYPNPTNDMLNIDAVDAQSIQIFNITGAKVKETNTFNKQISVAGLSNGVYIVKVMDSNNNVSVAKFTKN